MLRQTARSLVSRYRIGSAGGRRSRSKPHGLVVGLSPTATGNRGDQALNTAVIEALLTHNNEHILAMMTGTDRPDYLPLGDRLTLTDDCIPLFTTRRAFSEEGTFLRHIESSRALAVHGADVVDESYGSERSAGTFRALELAGRLGLDCRLLGFSVSNEPSESFRDRLLTLPENVRLMLRDPVSFRRLRDAGVERAELVADTAFTLVPAKVAEIDDSIRQFFDDAHGLSSGGGVVGVNLTNAILGKNKENFEQTVTLFAQALTRLLKERNERVMLLAHTLRGVDELRPVYERIDASLRDRVMLVDPLPHARVLKRLAGMCRHVFSCRMHLAIATLGMARPVSCFPYQGKFEGLFEHFGLDRGGLLSRDQLPKSSAELAHWMSGRLDQTDALAAQVAAKLPEIKRLAWKNYGGLIPQAALAKLGVA
ncbi:MAG: hypothetical protein GC164_15360 [Phycisphaera sp.]|nr:hypothetical protein [Phycisphaera sp.]